MKTFFAKLSALLTNRRTYTVIAYGLVGLVIVKGLIDDQPTLVIGAFLFGLYLRISFFPWWNVRGTDEAQRSFRKEQTWGWICFLLLLVGLLMVGLIYLGDPTAPPEGVNIGPINTAALNSTAQRVVIGNDQDIVSVHNAQNLEQKLYQFEPRYTNKFVALTFSPDGNILAAVDENAGEYSLRVWDLTTQHLLSQRFDDKLKNVRVMQFDLTAQNLITVDDQGGALLWRKETADDLRAWKRIRELRKDKSDAPFVVFDGSTRYFALARGNKIDLYHRDDDTYHKEISHAAKVVAIAFDEAPQADAKQGLYLLDENRCLLRHGVDPKLPAPLCPPLANGATAPKLVTGLIDPPHERWFAVYQEAKSKNKVVRAKNSIDIFALPSQTASTKPRAVTNALTPIQQLAADPDMAIKALAVVHLSHLVALSDQNQIVLLNLAANKKNEKPFVAAAKNDNDIQSLSKASAVAWHLDEHRLATISPDAKQIQFWNFNFAPEVGTRAHPEFETLDGKGGDIFLTAFAADKQFITVDRLGYVRVWENESEAQDTQILAREMQWPDFPVTQLAVAPNKILFVANAAGQVRRWNWETGEYQQMENTAKAEAIHALAVNGEGKILAVGYGDGEIHVRNAEDPKTLLLKHDGAITALAFAPPPHKNRLGSAGADKEPSMRVRVWSLDTPSAPNVLKTYGYAGVRPSLMLWNNAKLIVAGDAAMFYVFDTELKPSTLLETDRITLPHAQPPLLALAEYDADLIVLGRNGTRTRQWAAGSIEDGFGPLAPSSAKKALLGLVSYQWLNAHFTHSQGLRLLWGFGFAGLCAAVAFFVVPSMRGRSAMDVWMPDLVGAERIQANNYARDLLMGRQQLIQYVDESGTHIKNGKNGKNGAAPKALAAVAGLPNEAAPANTKAEPAHAAGQAESDETAVMSSLGGPGLLTVPEGYAAVMEKHGKITHVVGAGTFWLKKGEKAVLRVALFSRTTPVEVKEVWTRDQVLVTVHFRVRHIIEGGCPQTDPERPNHEHDPYPFDTRVIREKIWTPQRKADTDWVGTIKAVTSQYARQALTQYAFEDLLAGASAARTDLAKNLLGQLKTAMAPGGVNVTLVSIGDVIAPQEFIDLLQKRSKSAMEQRFHLQEEDNLNALALRRNEVDLKVMEQMGAIKFKLREQLIKQLTEPLTTNGAFANTDVAIRYMETMERIMQQMARDDFTTQRFIETMEKLVESGGQNHFYFPDMRELLGAGAAPLKEK